MDLQQTINRFNNLIDASSTEKVDELSTFLKSDDFAELNNFLTQQSSFHNTNYYITAIESKDNNAGVFRALQENELTKVTNDELIELLSMLVQKEFDAGIKTESESGLTTVTLTESGKARIKSLINSVTSISDDLENSENNKYFLANIIQKLAVSDFDIKPILENSKLVDVIKTIPEAVKALKMISTLEYYSSLNAELESDSFFEAIKQLAKEGNVVIKDPLLNKLNEIFAEEQFSINSFNDLDKAKQELAAIKSEIKEGSELYNLIFSENPEGDYDESTDAGSGADSKKGDSAEEEDAEDAENPVGESGDSVESAGAAEGDEAAAAKTHPAVEYLGVVNKNFFNGERSAAQLADEYQNIEDYRSNFYTQTYADKFIKEMSDGFNSGKLPIDDQTRNDKHAADAFLVTMFAQSQDTDIQELMMQGEEISYNAMDKSQKKYCVSLDRKQIGKKIDNDKVDLTKSIVKITEGSCDRPIDTSKAQLANNVVKTALAYCSSFNRDIPEPGESLFSSDTVHVAICGDNLPDELEYTN